jgi:hypothetical protein
MRRISEEADVAAAAEYQDHVSRLAEANAQPQFGLDNEVSRSRRLTARIAMMTPAEVDAALRKLNANLAKRRTA